MNILLVLIPLSLLVAVVGGIAFFWAVNNDQFDDLDSPALLPLLDADEAAGKNRETGVVGARSARGE
jgi:cbb3-type cytochrome oxidase maturation protein